MSTNVGKRNPWMLLRLAAAVLSLSGLLLAQTIIENPEKPLAGNAGRVLKLREVWRITDEGGKFYFKYPHDLQIADDGSVFLAEQGQFLRFSSDGKFLANLFKKGEGPGEIGREFSYFPFGDNLFIQDMNSQRLWRSDLEGGYQESVNLANRRYNGFIGVIPDGFLFLKTVYPPPSERTGKLLEVLHTIALVARNGQELRDVFTFRPRMFMMPQGMRSWDHNITTLSADGKCLYAFHGWDYLIDVLDLGGDKIVKRFRRRYPKIRYVEKEWELEWQKKYGVPKIEFESDIMNLYAAGSRLWVETSTDDKTRGRLFDVFDADGRFLDSFYIGAGKTLMNIQGENVFTLEKSEDETFRILKSRIER